MLRAHAGAELVWTHDLWGAAFDDGSARSAAFICLGTLEARLLLDRYQPIRSTLRLPDAVGDRSALRQPAGRSAKEESG